MVWGVSMISHLLQITTYLRNQLKQMEEYFINKTTQAGAYFLLTQEEEYVRHLPKFHVLERVHFQLVFVQKQVSHQLVQWYR